jgi:hypothetical protein
MAQRNQQHRPQGANGMHKVPAKSFSAKFSDKRELYTFMVSDCGIYCPAINTVTVWHLRDMVDGKKGKILSSEMRHLNLPFYEELTIEKIVEWARESYVAFSERYFPINRELFKFPRQVSTIPLHSITYFPIVRHKCCQYLCWFAFSNLGRRADQPTK